MPLLHKFSLQEHYNQLRDFLIQFLPSTVSLLGWLVGTGFYESDSHGKCNIWTSHPDPFHCRDPVVWIFDSDHRIRIFMTTEAVLDLGENTLEAIELADSAVYKGKALPNYFVDPEFEKLYNKSKEILGTVLKEYMHEKKKDEFVFLHGVNLLWSPVFHEVLNDNIESPCFKFVKPISAFDTEKVIALPDNLKISTLEKGDVNLVQSTNKVAYDFEYVQDCFRISSSIRRVDNNELAAWSMTHRDFFVGSLHVLPEYRCKGYAGIILQDLCRQHVDYYKRSLPADNAAKIYFGCAVEHFNNPSANLFRKNGWKTHGLGNTWIYGRKRSDNDQ